MSFFEIEQYVCRNICKQMAFQNRRFRLVFHTTNSQYDVRMSVVSNFCYFTSNLTLNKTDTLVIRISSYYESLDTFFEHFWNEINYSRSFHAFRKRRVLAFTSISFPTSVHRCQIIMFYKHFTNKKQRENNKQLRKEKPKSNEFRKLSVLKRYFQV